MCRLYTIPFLLFIGFTTFAQPLKKLSTKSKGSLVQKSQELLQLKSDSALFYALEAVELAATPIEKYKTLLNAGTIYYKFNDQKNSINFYKQAYNAIKNTKYSVEQAQVLEFLGLTCVESGDFLEAKEYYGRGLEISLKNKIDTIAVRIYLGLSSLYYSSQYRDLTLSRKNIQKAMEYALKLKNDFLIARAHEEMSEVDLHTNNDENGRINLNKALSYYRTSNNNDRISSIYKTLGDYFYRKNSEDSSIFYYLKAYEIREKEGDAENMAISATDLASMYAYAKNKDKFLEYGEIAKKMAQKNNSFNVNEYVYLWLSDGAAQLGMMKEAYGYHQTYFAAYDSTNRLKKSEEIIRESFQENLDKKLLAQKTENDKQIAVSKEKERQYRFREHYESSDSEVWNS